MIPVPADASLEGKVVGKRTSKCPDRSLSHLVQATLWSPDRAEYGRRLRCSAVLRSVQHPTNTIWHRREGQVPNPSSFLVIPRGLPEHRERRLLWSA